MMAQKSAAGRPRGQRFLLWAIFSVVFIVGIQLWAYERTWSERADVYGTGMTFKAILNKSWFASKDAVQDDFDDKKNQDHRATRELLGAVNSCKTQSAAKSEDAAKIETAECLTKLFAKYRANESLSTVLSRSPSKKGSDENLTEILEKQIGFLSDMLKNSTVFLELKDTREGGLSDTDTNWFMSTVHGPQNNDGFSEEMEFPSELSGGRLLCLVGNNTSDGTKNKYGFAWKGYLPPDSTLLPGLTLVADNYWDYNNIWHSMSALVNFVSWRARRDCVVPERLVLYHWGELVPYMGSWMDSVLHASFGTKLELEKMEQGPVCLERAVVNRRGLGGMSLRNMNSLFATVRCRARKFCEVETKSHNLQLPTHVTLLVRSGARAFKNPKAVTRVLEKVCEQEGHCHVEVAFISNLSFCEQVALMSRTDVLVTTHGAQMTNSMFMSEGSSVMEFIPKGWLEFAGVGQYIYSWLAEWSNLHHEGVWRDQDGPDCPFSVSGDTLQCFLFYKDNTVGHNETHLTDWTTTVIQTFRKRKEAITRPTSGLMPNRCTCEHVDRSR